MFEKAYWVGIPQEEYKDKEIYEGEANGRLAYFTLEFDLNQAKGKKLNVTLSAVSRYRMWMNGKPVGSGPCRGDFYRCFYDERKLTEFLQDGKNILSVAVLLGDWSAISGGADERTPLMSISPAVSKHRFSLEGAVCDNENQSILDLSTGIADWRVSIEGSWYMTARGGAEMNLGATREEIDFRKANSAWKKKSHGVKAMQLDTVKPDDFFTAFGLMAFQNMTERSIPLLEEEDKELLDAASMSLFPITVEAGQKKEILLKGKYLFNAYMRYFFNGGKNARIRFIYFERFVPADVAAGKTADRNEILRDDDMRGVIPEAREDFIILDGDDFIYEPFWYRTARFIKLEIEAADEDVYFEKMETLWTGYPLHAAAHISSSEPWVESLYKICERTLRNCMMDSYMDCPYYEQLQYPQDTRLQMLFTYAVSEDTDLAKKAIEDLHYSMTPYGLIQGRAPSGRKQIISTFSFFYIQMILEYYYRTGDTEILKKYRADLDLILETFEQTIDRSKSGTGLLCHPGFWAFVDWLPQWHDTFGEPEAFTKGPSAVVSLMYVYGLQNAATINELSGRISLAGEYRERAEEMLQNIKKYCYDAKKGLIMEGPDFRQYTQFTQSYGVLTGFFDLPEVSDGAAAMRMTVTDAEVLKCRFSSAFEFFRACEITGCYDLTLDHMNQWKTLLGYHCTTCPETPTDSRSECHGWSALPMYEFIRTIAGIKQVPAKPDEYTIEPHLEYVSDISGEIPVPGGMLSFRVTKGENGTEIALDAPSNIKITEIVSNK